MGDSAPPKKNKKKINNLPKIAPGNPMKKPDALPKSSEFLFFLANPGDSAQRNNIINKESHPIQPENTRLT